MVHMRIRNAYSPILAVLVFFLAGSFIYKSREFASAAPRERTISAQHVSVYHHIFRGLRFNYYSCTYNFIVDGSFHLGLSDCPQGIADDALKGMSANSAMASTEANATVYYDPVDPSVNSLLEFRAASENAYRVAVPWIGSGVLIIFFFAFGRLLEASEKRGKGGVAVDARGTVIYPEEIGLGFEFPGLSKREAANSAASPRLREQYLEVVNMIHPDRATHEADLALRERLMKEANAAFERDDAEALRRVLDEYRGAVPAP
jgi:hypothetical protein